MTVSQQTQNPWQEKQEKWARIWFGKLAAFHGHAKQRMWTFTADDVIAYLLDHLRRNTPSWKRLKIVESLMYYRRHVQDQPLQDLFFIRSTLMEIVERERLASDVADLEAEEIEDAIGLIDPREPDVIQNLRRAVRGKQRELETERAYVGKVRAFMRARGLKCQADFESIGPSDVEDHLTDLAVDGNVAVSTQDQAYYALLYLFTHVFKRDIGKIEAIRSKRGKQIPTVMSVEEVMQIFAQLRGVYLLIGHLLYGCGMRISEVLRLRMKDFDFDRMLIEVHASKGGKSRFVPLPECAVESIKRWMESRRILHEDDLDKGTASVWLPKALARKYPNAHRELKWQFLFASHRLSRDPRTGKLHRHHLHKDTFPTRLREAVRKAGIHKHISSHTFRHSFATHSLRAGLDICTIQELLGHSDIKTTRIYLHALNRDDVKVISPLDRLQAKNGQEKAAEACTPAFSDKICAEPVLVVNPNKPQPAVVNCCQGDAVGGELAAEAEVWTPAIRATDREVASRENIEPLPKTPAAEELASKRYDPQPSETGRRDLRRVARDDRVTATSLPSTRWWEGEMQSTFAMLSGSDCCWDASTNCSSSNSHSRAS